MDSFTTVKELKAIAKEQGIPGYYRMRKAELIEAIQAVEDHEAINPTPPPPNDIHTKAPEPSTKKLVKAAVPVNIQAPVNTAPYKHSKSINNFSLFKHLAKKAANSVKKELNKSADWITSNVKEPIKETIKEKFKKLKEKVKNILKPIEEPKTPEDEKPTTPKETSLNGYLKTYRIEGKEGIDPKTFLSESKQEVFKKIKEQKLPIKLKLIFVCEFIKENLTTGKIDEKLGYFKSLVEAIYESTDISEVYDRMVNSFIESIQKFQKEGSGWQFKKVEYLDVKIILYEPLKGSSYIPLPKKLASKKAIINVKNENDHECFKWAVTSAVFPRDKDPQRLDKEMRDNSEKINWEGLKFPVPALDSHIDKFEENNNLSISVLGYENGELCVLRPIKKENLQKINLLLISNDETNHYCWIKSMSRLISSQVSKHHGALSICDRCLNTFRSEELLKKHSEYCKNNGACKIVMPMEKDGSPKYLTFKNYNRKMRVPFVVYADFESFTENIHTCSPDESKWIRPSLVFYSARSCMGCCVKVD